MGTIQIVRVAILLTVQESYDLGVEAVKKPFGPRLGTPVPLAGEQSMTRVAGVFGNFRAIL